MICSPRFLAVDRTPAINGPRARLSGPAAARVWVMRLAWVFLPYSPAGVVGPQHSGFHTSFMGSRLRAVFPVDRADQPFAMKACCENVQQGRDQPCPVVIGPDSRVASFAVWDAGPRFDIVRKIRDRFLSRLRTLFFRQECLDSFGHLLHNPGASSDKQAFNRAVFVDDDQLRDRFGLVSTCCYAIDV